MNWRKKHSPKVGGGMAPVSPIWLRHSLFPGTDASNILTCPSSLFSPALERYFRLYVIARWRYFLSAVVITRWRYCLNVAMITIWHSNDHLMALLYYINSMYLYSAKSPELKFCSVKQRSPDGATESMNYILYAVMMTIWQYCLNVAMITRWHYCIRWIWLLDWFTW